MVYIIREIPRQHVADDVYIVFLSFSVAAVIVMVMLAWAYASNYIGRAGFVGKYAEQLQWLMDFMFDLKTELKLMCGLFALFVAPQILTYGLSGVFGYAATPRFMGLASRSYFWFSLKAFPAIAGAFAGICVCHVVFAFSGGYRFSSSNQSLFLAAYVAEVLLLFTFGVIYVYRIFQHDGLPSGYVPNRSLKLTLG
jgi:hypothetical protein